MDHKYVIISDAYPIIFANPIEHAKFSGVGKITSAGFYRVVLGVVDVYGKSESLGIGIKDKDWDQHLLQRLIFEREGY
jgi:hypothetical protein